MTMRQATDSFFGARLVRMHCALCGDDRGRLLGTFDGRYPIRRCATCGLTYTAARVSDSATRMHYKEDYIPADHRLEDGFGGRRKAAMERAASVLMERHPGGGAILDVGAAGGLLLSQLPGELWGRVALEPARVAARQLEAMGLEVVNDVYPSEQLDARRFDVIAMLDVVMLMPDPLAALAAARQQLGLNGTLAVEIPGYAYRAALHVGPVPLVRRRRWTDLDASIHLFFFSDRTLRLLLARAGFGVCDVVPLPPSARDGVLGQIQRRAGAVVERLPGVRSGSPSVAAKYLYMAEAIP